MDPVSAATTALAVIGGLTTAAQRLSDLIKTACKAHSEIRQLRREIQTFTGVLSQVKLGLEDPRNCGQIEQSPDLKNNIHMLKKLLEDCTSSIRKTRRSLGQYIDSKTGKVRRLKWAFMNAMQNIVANMKQDLRDGRERVMFAMAAFNFITTLRQKSQHSDASISSVLVEYASEQEALMKAAQNGDPRSAEVLLEKGVPVDWRNAEGRTPLSIAAEIGDEALVKLLISWKANINTVANKQPAPLSHRGGRTPLHWAAARGHKHIVTLLLAAGADTEARRSGGKSPTWEACVQDNVDLVRQMLDSGANVNARVGLGRSMLCQAVNSGGLDMVELLIQRDADVEAEFSAPFRRTGYDIAGKNQRSIHYAAFPDKDIPRARKLKILRQLAKRGKAKVNVTDTLGATPLHYAVRANWGEGVEELLRQKASTTKRDLNNLSPIDDAVRLGRLKCLRLLLQHPSLKRERVGSKDRMVALVPKGKNYQTMGELLENFFDEEHVKQKGGEQEGSKQDTTNADDIQHMRTEDHSNKRAVDGEAVKQTKTTTKKNRVTLKEPSESGTEPKKNANKKKKTEQVVAGGEDAAKQQEAAKEDKVKQGVVKPDRVEQKDKTVRGDEDSVGTGNPKKRSTKADGKGEETAKTRGDSTSRDCRKHKDESAVREKNKESHTKAGGQVDKSAKARGGSTSRDRLKQEGQDAKRENGKKSHTHGDGKPQTTAKSNDFQGGASKTSKVTSNEAQKDHAKHNDSHGDAAKASKVTTVDTPKKHATKKLDTGTREKKDASKIGEDTRDVASVGKSGTQQSASKDTHKHGSKVATKTKQVGTVAARPAKPCERKKDPNNASPKQQGKRPAGIDASDAGIKNASVTDSGAKREDKRSNHKPRDKAPREASGGKADNKAIDGKREGTKQLKSEGGKKSRSRDTTPQPSRREQSGNEEPSVAKSDAKHGAKTGKAKQKGGAETTTKQDDQVKHAGERKKGAKKDGVASKDAAKDTCKTHGDIKEHTPRKAPSSRR